MNRTEHRDTSEPTTRATRHVLDQRGTSQPEVSHPLTERFTPTAKDAAASKVEIPQYRRRAILAVWAAAALPMAALAWLVAPAVADRLTGEGYVPMVKAMSVCLMVGLIWQFMLVMALVHHEQRSLRWSTLREALWLRSPRSPRSGRTGGRIWLVLIPLVLAFAVANLFIPTFGAPDSRDLGSFIGSDAGQSFFSGNWSWFAVTVVLWVFNSALGEELLFRGFLLPRMNGAFGRGDWVANGVLFAAYHLHVPWSIPASLLDMFTLSYPTKRYQSAWIGIAVHSSQSVFIGAIVLALVL
jgi:membrane protease YdiL (CAAX protease family)